MSDAWRMTDRLEHEQGRGDPFAAAIRATRMPMIITDPRQHDNPIVFANDAFLRLSGYQRDEVMSRNCRFLQGPDTDPQTVLRVREAISHGHDIHVDILNYRRDGTPFWNALYVSPVFNEANDLVYFFASQLDVTERKTSQLLIESEKDRFEAEVSRRTRDLELALADLRSALEAKTLLLHEVDHRVKNNLQMISSLIVMQSRNIVDPEFRQSLRTMLGRVEALSTVHRRLYQSDDVGRFDVAELARDLAGDLVAASGRDDITLRLDLEPVDVPAAKAAPLALMLNELVTNAIKHAFNGRGGSIALSMTRTDDRFVVTMEDDGAGMPKQRENGQTSGLILVQNLARQLQAEVRWPPTPVGTRVEIALPTERTIRSRR